uniref:Uncharacterized protein n=1 Tax=Picea sitchensis TaxID=3332 RepID=A9NN89_PICSI|nr:unknown [Picea sitchensis]
MEQFVVPVKLVPQILHNQLMAAGLIMILSLGCTCLEKTGQTNSLNALRKGMLLSDPSKLM